MALTKVGAFLFFIYSKLNVKNALFYFHQKWRILPNRIVFWRFKKYN